MEKPALVAVTIRNEHYLFQPLHSAQERVVDVFPVVFLRIIQRVV